VELYLHSPNTS